MENNIEMIENILNTERRNRRGNREIRFEVNSNYYKAVSKLLSDYKRVLKENELLRKDIESWKKYCEEIEEERIEMSNKNCELEFEVEKLQKENEELKIKNNAIKRESEAYAEDMIRLDIEKQDYFEKYRYHLQQNERLTKEFSNVIPIQKVKDMIEKYKKLSDKFYVKFLESDRYNTDIREKGIKCDAIILALEELIEKREEK